MNMIHSAEVITETLRFADGVSYTHSRLDISAQAYNLLYENVKQLDITVDGFLYKFTTAIINKTSHWPWLIVFLPETCNIGQHLVSIRESFGSMTTSSYSDVIGYKEAGHNVSFLCFRRRNEMLRLRDRSELLKTLCTPAIDLDPNRSWLMFARIDSALVARYSLSIDTDEITYQKIVKQALRDARAGDPDALIPAATALIPFAADDSNYIDAMTWLNQAISARILGAYEQKVMFSLHRKTREKLNLNGAAREIEEIVQIQKEGAEALDPWSMREYALWCLQKDKTPGQKKEGLKWLERSAQLGDPESLADLGLTYYHGDLVAENIPDALFFFDKAIEGGCRRAVMLKGLTLLAPTAYQNEKSGLALLHRSADAGSRDAYYALALHYMRRKELSPESDGSDGISYLEKAASMGQVTAQIELIKVRRSLNRLN